MGLTTKKLLNILLIGVISISFSGCVFFYPQEIAPRTKVEKECQLYFKQTYLNAEVIEGYGDICEDELCAYFLMALPVGSLVVSGSMVVVNNTLHWIEYQGRCDDGLLKNLIK